MVFPRNGALADACGHFFRVKKEPVDVYRGFFPGDEGLVDVDGYFFRVQKGAVDVD
jgi:hypothetical protein